VSDRIRIHRFPAGDPVLAEEVESWLRAGTCDQGERQGAATAWLLPGRGLAVKIAEAPRGLAAWRPSRHARAAAAHARLLPISSPEPLVLGELRDRWGRLVRSCLAMRLVAGVAVDRCLDQPAAVEAIIDLFADLHRRRIVYGDLHPGNMLWDGRRLALIDLESMRPPLHGLVAGYAWRRAWAGLLYRIPDPDRLRDWHRRAWDRAGRGWFGGEPAAWRSILAIEARVARRVAAKHAAAQRGRSGLGR
jgi:hypothetical protein